MRTIVDPFTGKVWTEKASRRELAAGVVVLLSCAFLFLVLPFL